MSFQQQYVYNSMLLTRICLSWLYFWGHILEILFFSVLFDVLWDLLPLVEQGRVLVFEFLVQRPINGTVTPLAEKPLYHLINKFKGPCVPLRTYGHSEVFADATDVSMQTAYGIMGANWKVLGEARLKYWSTILKDNIIVVGEDEQ